MDRTAIAVLLLSLSAPAWAVGVVEQNLSPLGLSDNWVLSMRWTGDAANGSVPVTPAAIQNCCQGYFITQVEIAPGSPAPTSAYSVAITDPSGNDILAGAAAALSAINPGAFAVAGTTPPLQGTLTLAISGQNVPGAQGVIFIFLVKNLPITSALSGSNVGNSPNWLTIANPPIADSRRYNFTSQTPGGTLTAATPSSITMHPVPFGVNGSDVGHSLYVSGGSGTAEACLITGGTGTSGQASGQIILTCANTHTGAWAVRSASDGIQEAWNAANGEIVLLLPGTYHVYAAITLNGPGALNCGAASFPSFGSILQSQTATQDIILVNSQYPVVINNCNFDAAVTKTAGAGVKLACGSTCTPTPNFRVWAGVIIAENTFNNQFAGVDVEAAYGFVIRNNLITGTVATGTDLILRNVFDPIGEDSIVDGNFIDSPSAANIVSEGGGVKIANNKILHGNYGILLQVPDGAIINDGLITANSIEGQTTAGIFMRRKGPLNTGYWGNIQIQGNQLTGVHSSDTCILSQSAGADNKSVQYVDIKENNISFCDTGISIATNLTEIQGNTLLPQVHGIVTTGATNTVVQNNTMLSFGTAANTYTLSTGTVLTDTSTGLLFANLPSVQNGSLVFCADCKNVTDDTTGTFDSAVAGSGHGTNALRENGAWRVH